MGEPGADVMSTESCNGSDLVTEHTEFECGQQVTSSRNVWLHLPSHTMKLSKIQ